MKKLLFASLAFSTAFGATAPTKNTPIPATASAPKAPSAQAAKTQVQQETGSKNIPPMIPTPQAPAMSTGMAAQPSAQAVQHKFQLVNIGVPSENRHKVAEILNKLLANEFTLYVKTLNYHWNIKGPLFSSLHKLFQQQYESLATIIDDIAERARALGEPALGTMQEFTRLSQVRELPGAELDEGQMIKDLLDGHEAVIALLNIAQQDTGEKFKDMGTNNLLLNIIEKQQKIAWMLRAHLEHLVEQQ